MNDSYTIDDLLEIELPNDDSFLQIKETLTRCGVVNFKTKTLYQTCHILHKHDRYFLVHFKEMFALDGKCARSHISEEDYDRRNRIAQMLEKWGLCSLIKSVIVFEGEHRTKLFVLKYQESKEIVPETGKLKWTLETKYDFVSDKEKEIAIDN